RTQMGTGGAPPRSQIRDILLQENKDRNGPKDYEPTKTEIRRREAILAKWINRHDITAVFSPQCSKTMSILPSTLGPHICTPCRLVPKIKSFQNALHREEGTIKPKCTPHEYQNPLLGGVYLKHNDIAELVKKVRRFVYYIWNGYLMTYHSRAAEREKAAVEFEEDKHSMDCAVVSACI
ncbi:hypothetical protein BT96DRAFT_833033, partial [Gymnopus androsaceus JB14]